MSCFSSEATTLLSLRAAGGFFGGLSEPGESPLGCFLREAREESGLNLNAEEVTALRSYPSPRTGWMRHVFLVRGYMYSLLASDVQAGRRPAGREATKQALVPDA